MIMQVFRIAVAIGLIVVQIIEKRVSEYSEMAVESPADEKREETPEEIFANRVARKEQRERLIRKGIMYRGADGKLHRVTE